MFSRRPVSLIRAAVLTVVLAVGVSWAWSAWVGSPASLITHGDANSYSPTTAERQQLSMEAQGYGLDPVNLVSECFELIAKGLDPRLPSETTLRWCSQTDGVASITLPIRPLPSDSWSFGIFCASMLVSDMDPASSSAQCSGLIEAAQGVRGSLGFDTHRSIEFSLNGDGSFIYRWWSV